MMRRLGVLMVVVMVAAMAYGCRPAHRGGVNIVADALTPRDKAPVAVAAQNNAAGLDLAVMDLPGDEVLAAAGNTMMGPFMSAKIMTPASPATSGETEVLFVNGKKQWSKHVIPSHKASRDELRIGMMVFVNDNGNVAADDPGDYRKRSWRAKRVTSTDKLFRDAVELDGREAYIKWVRIPNEPIP